MAASQELDPNPAGLSEKVASQEIGTRNSPSTLLDIALEDARPIDPEVERRVIRKIDWFLVPAMVIGICLANHKVMSRFCSPKLNRLRIGVL